MSNRRKRIENLEEWINSGQKHYVRYEEGAQYFHMSEKCFKQLAWQSGAVRKMRVMCLVNIDVVLDYLERMD